MAVVKGNFPPRPAADNGVAHGGEPPYDGGMEVRLKKLEEFATDAKERLVKIDARLENAADKTDIKMLATSLSAEIKALTASVTSDIKVASSSLAADAKAHRADVDADLKTVKATNQSTIDQKASELRVESQKNATEISRWILATVISLFLGFAGLFFAMNNSLKNTSPPGANQSNTASPQNQQPTNASATSQTSAATASAASKP